MELSDREFEEIVNYVKLNYGINLSKKRRLIIGRLENYLVRNGFNNYAEYMSKVKNNANSEEAKKLVDYLTTNHTYFLRESMHFDYMKNVILPQLVEQEKMNKTIYLWSGAASTGEEPYTIVMTMQDFFRNISGKWDTKILATDISMQALQKGMNGIYLQEQLEPLPDSWKKMYFDKYSDTEMKVKKHIRDEVIFRQLNLMNPLNFKNKFHIVFLRNVMIYFEEDTKVKLINRIYDWMQVGGYLFIGMSEVLDKTNTKFQYVQPSIYRKIR